jgi:lipoate-protein ligase A
MMSKYGAWASAGYPEPMLRIYTYRSHCAVIGRFQNMLAEVNLPECEALGVEVNRRMTGGGTGFMGGQQLMVALASSVDHPVIPAHPARILPKLARGVVLGLAELGVKADFRSKNDVVVNGRKIGGTAICIEENGALLYHATVLLDFDIELMLRVLDTPAEKISDKGISSFEQRMTSVSEVLGTTVDAGQAREAICRGFEHAFKMSAVHTPFTTVEMEAIGKLEREKYLSSAWLEQRQPAPDMLGASIRKTPSGLVRTYVSLIGDTIKSVLITGDFFSGNRLINDIESALKWGRADEESISRTIRVVMKNSSSSIQGIDAATLASIIYSAVRTANPSSQ